MLLICLLAAACGKEENLPATEYVMVKFQNKSGQDIQDLVVSRSEVGNLGKGKSSDYIQYESMGQQFGYALVEAVGTVNGKKHFTASVCQGECGTASAPHGTWLEAGYYKVSIHLSKDEDKAMEFRMVD